MNKINDILSSDLYTHHINVCGSKLRFFTSLSVIINGIMHKVVVGLDGRLACFSSVLFIQVTIISCALFFVINRLAATSLSTSLYASEN